MTLFSQFNSREPLAVVVTVVNVVVRPLKLGDSFNNIRKIRL